MNNSFARRPFYSARLLRRAKTRRDASWYRLVHLWWTLTYWL